MSQTCVYHDNRKTKQKVHKHFFFTFVEYNLLPGPLSDTTVELSEGNFKSYILALCQLQNSRLFIIIGYILFARQIQIKILYMCM